MRFGPIEFRASLVPTVAAAVAVALTASLGRWQLSRAEEKRGLERDYATMQTAPPLMLTSNESDAAAFRFRRLVGEGEYLPARQIFIDNQMKRESAGYHVITPLRIGDSGRYVLVNRGWIARGPDYPTAPQVPVPTGRVRVEGYGALPVKRFLELSSDTIAGDVWQNLTFERYRRATGLELLPVILVQTAGNDDGLVAVHERPDFGIATHEGYAFQWFALTAAIVAIYFFVNTRHAKR
jgi:surfeit locus 1 family protein